MHRARDRERLGRADAIYGSGGAIGPPAIDSVQLLPVARSPAALPRFPPLHHLDARTLAEQLVTEVVLAELARIAMGALAAESSARMQVMSAARDNIERKLADLQRAEHRARQEQITTELLDLITGVEASSSTDAPLRRG